MNKYTNRLSGSFVEETDQRPVVRYGGIIFLSAVVALIAITYFIPVHRIKTIEGIVSETGSTSYIVVPFSNPDTYFHIHANATNMKIRTAAYSEPVIISTTQVIRDSTNIYISYKTQSALKNRDMVRIIIPGDTLRLIEVIYPNLTGLFKNRNI